jgi:hypothetical protein
MQAYERHNDASRWILNGCYTCYSVKEKT